MCGISLRYNFIFLRNHKCGSTTCQKILLKYIDIIASENKDHFDKDGNYIIDKVPWIHAKSNIWRQYVDELKIDRDLPTITTVRNPWDRMVSLYHYSGWHSKVYGKKGFPNFVRGIYTDNCYEFTNFIFDEEGNKIVDHVIKLENFKEEMKEIFEKYGITFNDKDLCVRANKSKRLRKNYRDYYDEESVEMVREMFKYEIEYFNYEF